MNMQLKTLATTILSALVVGCAACAEAGDALFAWLLNDITTR